MNIFEYILFYKTILLCYLMNIFSNSYDLETKILFFNNIHIILYIGLLFIIILKKYIKKLIIKYCV